MSRRRIMLMNGQEVEEMKEWVDIYENTLNENLDSIVINGLNCTEVEAYIINPNTRDVIRNIYLTTSANGNIYAEPRIYKVVDNITYQNKVSSLVELNVEKINGITLMPQSGSLEAGSKIYIRVR